MPLAIDTEGHEELSRQLAQCERDGQDMAAEIEQQRAQIQRLTAALTAFVSAWQTNTRVPESVEIEAVELCGGMAAIRALEQIRTK